MFVYGGKMKNGYLVFVQQNPKGKIVIFFLILFFLTGCLPKQPAVPSTDVSDSYKLEWHNQHPQGDYNPILVPQNGAETIVVEFVSDKPIPSDSVLALYLHKDRSLSQRNAGNPDEASERVHWTSTPGNSPAWFSSLFEHVSWKGDWVEMEDGPAMLIDVTDEHVGKTETGLPIYHFEFKVDGNDLPIGTCGNWHSQHNLAPNDPIYHFCREDFGVAFLGQAHWLMAEIGKGGRPENGGNFGHANAWWHIQLCDNDTIPCSPSSNWWYWINADILAFVFICLLWFFLLPFSSSRFIKGLLFVIGVLLIAIIIGWVVYGVFLSPSRLSLEKFDLVKRQTIARMRQEEEWNVFGYLQPYGCSDTLPTANPSDADLAKISRNLNIATLYCPRSTWSHNQPGVILAWRDIFGTQVRYVFGAQWKLYQEHYAMLGRPTSLPYPMPSSPNHIAIDFGISYRVIYRQAGQGEGQAWIQERKPLFAGVPNIFCVVGLTTDKDSDCWTPSEPTSTVYLPFAPQPDSASDTDDWAYEKDIPFGGVFLSISTWTALALGIGLYLGFFVIVGFIRFANSITNYFFPGCIAQLSNFIVDAAWGAMVMITGIILAYAKISVFDIDFDTLQISSILFPEGFMGFLARSGTNWFETWRHITVTEQNNPWGLLIMLPQLAWGGFLGLILMPVWAGMGLGGTAGAWIGIVVEIGLLIAGVLFHILPINTTE